MTPEPGLADEKRPKVAIYVRVSTEEQAKEGISIAAQIDRCRKFCEAKGWNIHDVYEDAGFSAGSTKRPAFQKLLEDVKSQEFSILLVYKIDRFSRNLKDLIIILESLKGHGVNFTSVTEQIDTTSAMGEAFFQIIGVFAQLERGMVSERVQMAFEKKLDDGEFLARPPLGYRYEDNRLIVDEDKAEVIREVFRMWAAGERHRTISDRFGIPTSTLYTIIRNPVYIGKIRHKEGLYEGMHEAILDEGLFNHVQRMLDGQ